MSRVLLRYHRMQNNLRAACEEAGELFSEPTPMGAYVDMRLAGESRKMAAMLALRQGPALRTDSEFRRGHTNGSQFSACPWVGTHHRRAAERAGLDPTGRIYLSGLARYPGDPAAWVSGRGDIRRLVEDRGWGCSGAVNVPRREVEPMKDIPVSAEIVGQYAARLRRDNPSLSALDAWEKAQAIRSGQGDPGPPRVSTPEGEAAVESEDIMVE